MNELPPWIGAISTDRTLSQQEPNTQRIEGRTLVVEMEGDGVQATLVGRAESVSVDIQTGEVRIRMESMRAWRQHNVIGPQPCTRAPEAGEVMNTPCPDCGHPMLGHDLHVGCVVCQLKAAGYARP